jgi:hypothetical protein
MSTRYDDTWQIGETWSAVIVCTDENGGAINPVSADWKLKTMDGITTTLALTESSGIAIVGSVCTITIPVVSQTMDPKAYRHRLKITDGSSTVSRQVHGQIQILADL